MTNTFETTSYEIPVHNMDYLNRKIEKLNKVCAKLSLAAIVMEVGAVYSKEVKPARFENGVQKPAEFMEFHTVSLIGEAPKLAGWTFVGKREPLEGAVGIILAKAAPGQTLPAVFQDDHALTCDHCQKRARRNDTFVVSNGERFMEVGRSCLKDFLGHANPNTYANYADALYNIDSEMSSLSDYEGFGFGAHAMSLFSIIDVVTPSVYLVKKDGFVSRQYANENNESTSSRVNSHLYPGKCPQGMTADEWFKLNNIPFTSVESEEAAVIVEWLKGKVNDSSEFWINVGKLSVSGAIPLRMTGYIAAAVSMYMKERGEAKIRDSIKASLVNEALGNEGDKTEFTATVISSFSFQTSGAFACTKWIITMKTATGHLVKMFTTSGDSGVKKDATVKVKGKLGASAPESYAKSPFHGMMVTTMAPRARINSVE